MSLIVIHAVLIKWQDPARQTQVVVPHDFDDFEKFAPYGFDREVVRCIVDTSEDRYYPLLPTCPDDGLTRWTLDAHEAVELAEEAEILALPQALRDRKFPGYETVADRKARRTREDAEADQRAADARAKAEADAAAAEAAFESRVQAAAAKLTEAVKP